MFAWRHPRFSEHRFGAPALEFAPESAGVLRAAGEEAQRLQHRYVGTEHILLGLVKAAPEVFTLFQLAPADVVRGVEAVIRPGAAGRAVGGLPYTSRAKRVIEAAVRGAQHAGAPQVTPSHLLAGCARIEQGTAAEVLRKLGLDFDRIWEGVRGAASAPVSTFRMTLDDTSDLSIYEQIVTRIREAIATGALRPGERLPTVRALADQLDVAPGTVARAYSELERVKLVKTEGSRGTRVADQTPPAAPDGMRHENLVGLLRPVAVAAFHLGATAQELRTALDEAMKQIFDE